MLMNRNECREYMNEGYHLLVEKRGVYYDATLTEGWDVLGKACCPSYESALAWARDCFDIEFKEV